MLIPIIMPVIFSQINSYAEETRRSAAMLSNSQQRRETNKVAKMVDCYYCKNSQYIGFLCQDCGRTIE